MCKTDYVMVNHGILNAIVKRWHTETSSFHLPHGKMSIRLDDVFCLMHLPIRRKLLDRWEISSDGALELMVDYLGVDLEAAMKEFETTRGAHARFRFPEKVCTYELLRAQQATGDDEKFA